MKYQFLYTNIEGAVQKKEDGAHVQNISIVGSLQKDDGTEIMKLTDNLEVQFTDDMSISACEQKVQNDAVSFVTEKYAG